MKSLCGCEGAVPVAQCPAHSGLACAFLARGGTNAGRRSPGASPRSLLRRDVTAPWDVAIAAATRVGPGADAGRQQPDTLGRRSAADGRGRSACLLQRCTRRSGLDPDRRRVASRCRHRAAIATRTNTGVIRRPLPCLDMTRIGPSMPSRPERTPVIAKSVSDQ
jgi:hypothetical protein